MEGEHRNQLPRDSTNNSSSNLKNVPIPNAGLLLVQAANAGNIALLERAIEAGVALDSVSDDGSSALHCAARTGQVAMVETLFRLGANITIVNKNNRSPFKEAILGGDIATIEYMLGNGMSGVECPNSLLSTFDIVLRNQSTEVARSFVHHFQGKAIFKQHGLKLLRRAINQKHVFLVRWLSSSNFYEIHGRPKTQYIPLRHAAEVGHAGILEALLASANINPNITGGHDQSAPLHIAVERGALEIVKLLLEDSRVDVNVKTSTGGSPLTMAVLRNNTEITKLILAHPKVDVNSVQDYTRRTPLHRAVYNSRVLPSDATADHSDEALDFLNIDEGGEPEPVINCSHLQMVQVLCQAPGICFSMKDKNGDTPLQLAVSKGCWPVVQCLLRYSEAKKNLRSSAHITLPPLRTSDLPSLLQAFVLHEDFQSVEGFKELLFSATRNHVSEMVGQLSQTQVFKTILMDDDTATALLCAVCIASHSTSPLERILRRPDTDVNQRLEDGLAALHVAVIINSPQAVELLLEHDQIDVEIIYPWFQSQNRFIEDQNLFNRGKTALQIALSNYDSQSAIVSLFAAYEKKKAPSWPTTGW